MFAGIHSLELQPQAAAPASGKAPDAVVTAMVSKQMENVAFSQAIDVGADPRVNAWLSATEAAMKASLIAQLDAALGSSGTMMSSSGGALDVDKYVAWVDQYAAQIVLLASGVKWSSDVDAALAARKAQPDALNASITRVLAVLSVLASKVMTPLSTERRSKYEQLITEHVHERDVTRSLDKHGIADANDFEWLCQLRYCWSGAAPAPPTSGRVTRAASAAIATAESCLRICLANASFPYGFEYLGVGERLVQTPLTDRCYLTLTQALHLRLGGNPFGPAGTGKTESVKALGAQLGRCVQQMLMGVHRVVDWG